MSKPIPVWENNWKGWTSERCIKNGHQVFFTYCIGCGRPKQSIIAELREQEPKLIEKIDYDLEEKDGAYEVIET